MTDEIFMYGIGKVHLPSSLEYYSVQGVNVRLKEKKLTAGSTGSSEGGRSGIYLVVAT